MDFQDLRRLLQDSLARLELPRRLQALPRWLLDRLRRLSLPIERREEVLEELEQASSPGFDFFLLVVPEHSGGRYLKALARISRFFRDAAFRQKLTEAETLDDVIRAIEEEDAKL